MHLNNLGGVELKAVQWQLFQNINDEIEVLRTAGLRNDPARSQRPAADDPDGIMAWLDGRGIVQQVICPVVKREGLLKWFLGVDQAGTSHGGCAWIGVSEGNRGRLSAGQKKQHFVIVCCL